MPEPQDQSPSQGKSYELPKRDFFSEENMDKYATEMNLFADDKEQVAPAPKAEAKAPEKKPCPNCPDGKTEKTEEAKPETRKPLKVLKVNGQDYPIYSEKDLDDLAQKGAHYTQERQKDAKWEKSLTERESKLEQAIQNLTRLTQQGAAIAPQKQDAVKVAEEKAAQDAELEAIEDPAAREAIKKRDAELRLLREQNEQSKQVSQQIFVDKITKELDNVLVATREKYPFTEIKDDDGRDVTKDAYMGLFQQKMLEEKSKKAQDPTYEPRPIHELMEDTSRDMYFLETSFKGKAANDAVLSADKVTADLVLEKFPQVAEEIGQRAVAAHLKTMESAPPVTRGRSDGLMRRTGEHGKGGSGNHKSLEDAFNSALNDPDISGALDDAQRKARFSA